MVFLGPKAHTQFLSRILALQRDIIKSSRSQKTRLFKNCDSTDIPHRRFARATLIHTRGLLFGTCVERFKKGQKKKKKKFRLYYVPGTILRMI